MGRPDWAPEEVDLTIPSVARIYDYWLGGAHNFAADREMSQRILSVVPHFRFAAQANREFLFRAVRFMVDAGIRQFLDLGSGIPTVGNVHEIAQKVAPESRVVYVDIDPVAVAHSQQILAGNDRVAAIQRDVRDPDAVFDDLRTRALLDLGQPLGVLMVAILHYVPDADDPYAMVARYRQALCPGSYLALAHGTDDEQPAETAEAQRLTRQTRTPLRLRTRSEIEPFFTDLELVEPGLVWAPLWRPNEPAHAEVDPHRSVNYAGVARRP